MIPVVFLEIAQGADEAGARLDDLVVEAVRAVPAAEAAELWIVGFRSLASLKLPLHELMQHLTRTLAGLPKGPLRVSLPLLLHSKSTFKP